MRRILFILSLLFINNFPCVLHAQEAKMVVQTGHPATIHKLAFNEDGTLLASADKKNNLLVWQLNVGREMNHFNEKHAINCLLFSEDSKSLFCGTAVGGFSMWDIEKSDRSSSLQFPSAVTSIVQSHKKDVLYIAAGKLYELNVVSLDTTRLLDEAVVNMHFNKEKGEYYLINEFADLAIFDGTKVTQRHKLISGRKKKRLKKANGKLDKQQEKYLSNHDESLDEWLAKDTTDEEVRNNITRIRGYQYSIEHMNTDRYQHLKLVECSNDQIIYSFFSRAIVYDVKKGRKSVV